MGARKNMEREGLDEMIFPKCAKHAPRTTGIFNSLPHVTYPIIRPSADLLSQRDWFDAEHVGPLEFVQIGRQIAPSTRRSGQRGGK